MGASLSIINDKSFQRLFEGTEKLMLEDTGVTLHTCFGEAVRPKGVAEVMISANHLGVDNSDVKLPLLVVSCSRPSLLGRDWLEERNLDWAKIRMISLTAGTQDKLDKLLTE